MRIMGLYRPRYAVDVYRLAREGVNDKTIAKEFGLSGPGFSGWKKNYAAVRYALYRARRDRVEAEKMDWTEYVRGRLPPRLQKTWDKLMEFDKEASGYSQAEKLLQGKSTRMRQQLLVFSILSCGFNLSKALQKVRVSRQVFRTWMEEDPEFTELLHEVQEVKKDFFEEGLVRLIKSGDSPATIFANRTINRDRGYAEMMEHHHTVGFAPIPVAELDLPPETLRVLLEALRRKQLPETNSPALPPPVMEAQMVEKEKTDGLSERRD